MKRILLSTLMFLTTIAVAFADEVSFIGSAPKSVVVNKRFNLSYEVNTKTDKAPTIPTIDGLRILAGPSPSVSISKSNINGHVTSSQTITYTYIVVAEKEGEITIPAASVLVKGENIISNPITIKVLPEGRTPVQQQSNNSSTNISDEELFVRAIVNKTKVYEREAIELIYKVYSVVDLGSLTTPSLSFKGFNTQEVELSQRTEAELEHYNGVNYLTSVWQKFILFPQETGKVEIPSIDYEAVVYVDAPYSMDPFGFMSFSNKFEVRKKLKTNKIVINVEKLPSGKPADFSGGVGRFTISSSASTTGLKSNEEFTYKVIVKGDGNMRMMGDPVVAFPTEFDVYDPIVNNNFKLTSKGFSGEKVYEYIVTPRTAGDFTIPAAKFSFFDPTSRKYKSVESKELTINVEKGSASVVPSGNIYVVKEDGKILASDIRYIKLGNEGHGKNGSFFASTTYYILYIIVLFAFALIVFVYRKRLKVNSDTTLLKTKKANSIAIRRLKNAKLLMRNNSVNEFYDEILKAVWGYMSDKLNIPLSQLSKDNISSKLEEKGCDEKLNAELVSLLNEGEFARYAPGDTGATMDKVYTMALNVISKMENSIRK